MAKCLKMPLADVIEMLSELGVRSPIEYDDYLKSLAAVSGFGFSPDDRSLPVVIEFERGSG